MLRNRIGGIGQRRKEKRRDETPKEQNYWQVIHFGLLKQTVIDKGIKNMKSKVFWTNKRANYEKKETKKLTASMTTQVKFSATQDSLLGKL